MLLTTSPVRLSQTVTPSRSPSIPSSVTYFMDGPLHPGSSVNYYTYVV